MFCLCIYSNLFHTDKNKTSFSCKGGKLHNMAIFKFHIIDFLKLLERIFLEYKDLPVSMKYPQKREQPAIVKEHDRSLLSFKSPPILMKMFPMN